MKQDLPVVQRCKSIACNHNVPADVDFCAECTDLVAIGQNRPAAEIATLNAGQVRSATPASSLAALYPKYHKDVSQLQSVDVYAVHQLFGIDDPSGCLQHASKKLLLSGVRTGNKTKEQDIREARDTLNRWLELHS